jgi:hypothetical protein
MIGEKFGKPRADLFRHFNRIRQRARNRVGASAASIKEYSDLENLDIHVHYGVSGVNYDRREYCIMMKPVLNQRPGINVGDGATLDVRGCNLCFLNEADTWDKQPVLIGYVALMKEGEQFIRWGRAMVGLHSLQNCGCPLPYPIFNLVFVFVEPLTLEVDGELGLISVRRGPDGMLDQQKCPEKMVKRAPDVVHAISGHQTPVGSRKLLQEIESKNIQPIFGLTFFGDGVGSRVASDSIDGTLEFVKVFLCPSEFRPESV